MTGSGPDSFVPGQAGDRARAGPSMATETRWLLQQRLRAASLVLVVGFGLFFVRSLVLHWDRLESLAVLFHGMMLGSAAPEPRRALQPMEADAPRSFGRSRSRCSR